MATLMNKHSSTNRTHRRALAVTLGISLSAMSFVQHVYGNEVNFEGLTLGASVNGQAGWTVEDEFGFDRADIGQTPFDEAVVDDGTGNTVWRVSNAVTTGSFSNLPASHTSPLVAGEAGSALWNDRGSDHTMPLSPPNAGGTPDTNTFHTSFRFKSATDAAQPGLTLSISPAAKQSPYRNSFLGITDDGTNGLDLSFYETGVSADPFGTGNFPEIASDLSYDQWHTVDLFIEFADGENGDTTGNDVVTVLVDDALAYTGTTWESFYRGGGPGTAPLNIADLPHRQAVDSILFRLNSNSVGNDNLGNGFFFDDVGVYNQAFVSIPESASIALWCALGLGIFVCGCYRTGRNES